MVECEVEGPGKGWLSHEQIFQYAWKIFLATSRVLNFCNKFSKYIGKVGHVSLPGPLSATFFTTKRPWERGCNNILLTNTYKLFSTYQDCSLVLPPDFEHGPLAFWRDGK